MKLGIFGGTFNPPHLGHLIVAESVREQLKLDRLFFVPSYSPPHKFNLQIALPSQRFEMVQLSVHNNKYFSVSDIEIKRQGKSYSIDTIHSMSLSFPRAQIYFIIGMDNLIDFPQWKLPNEIISRVELIVMNRPGYDREVKNEFSRYANFIKVPHLDISSTDIRRRVKMERSIRYLVNEEVEKYIIRKGLYKL